MNPGTRACAVDPHTSKKELKLFKSNELYAQIIISETGVDTFSFIHDFIFI